MLGVATVVVVLRSVVVSGLSLVASAVVEAFVVCITVVGTSLSVVLKMGGAVVVI